jgi:hypothetical protein
MFPDRHRREAELFDRACDLGPEEQRALLERECAGDRELRGRLDALLAREREPREPGPGTGTGWPAPRRAGSRSA